MKAVAAILIIAVFAVSIFLIAETGITGNAVSLKNIKSPVKTNAAKAPAISSILLQENYEEDKNNIAAAEKEFRVPAPSREMPRVSITDRFRHFFGGGTAETTYNIALSAADRIKFPTVNMDKYQRFERENPLVFRLMIWKNSENPSGKSIIYSQQKMESLSHYIALLETGQPFPFTAPSSGLYSETLSEGRFVFIRYNETDAWNMFAPHLAVSLFVEVNRIVPWTIRSYNENELKLLFDGTRFITYYSTTNNYKFAMDKKYTGSGLQGITDWNAFYNLNFLRENGMIMPSQQESIYEVTEWFGRHLFHDSYPRAYSVRRDYGYNTSNYPVDKILNPPEGINSYTEGCSGTASLYAALLHTINIPVMKNDSLPNYFPDSPEGRRIGWHTGVIFPTANLALVHGDDPYSMSYLRGIREVPEEEAMYTIPEFTAFNNPVLEEGSGSNREEQIANQASYNHMKKMYELGYKYSAYGLLAHRAHELTYYPSPSSSNRMETKLRSGFYKPMFDEAFTQRFIADLDANITAIGSGNFESGKRILINWLVSRNREVD